ncbi:MAG TPA: hypothetical protein DCL73_01750, partial [Treponema sp.]|nr:hypothetical protein [Treponema sp.]
AIAALGKKPEKRNADILLRKAQGGKNSEPALTALSTMICLSEQIFFYILNLFNAETDEKKVHIFARILSVRFEYFLPGLSETEERNDSIIIELIESGKTSDLISFMNENSDMRIENHLISIIQKQLGSDKSDPREFQMYLKETILQKIGLYPLMRPGNDRSERDEQIKRLPLSVLLAAIITVPFLFFFGVYRNIPVVSFKDASTVFVNDMLQGFGYYTLTLDIFYFFLAFLSFTESTRERNSFSRKSDSFLFIPYMLPSVSILTPAFCEQETIIESVESMLNI